MNVSTVLAGCLVLVLCAVNTQACANNVVLMIDCLDKDNAPQWEIVKNYAKYIVHHLPGTANTLTDVRVALVVVDGVRVGVSLATQLKNETFSKDKLELMAFINGINTDRPGRKLVESFKRLITNNVFSDEDFTSKSTSFVIIKDSSVPDGVTTDPNDELHTLLDKLNGKPLTLHFLRINDKAEEESLTALTTWFKKGAGADGRSVVDNPRNSYTDLTHADAFNFVKTTLYCDPPFGSATDPLENVPTLITLPLPPVTDPIDDTTTHSGNSGNTTSSTPLSLTKTSSRVVGLWMCVTIVTTAAVSTF